MVYRGSTSNGSATRLVVSLRGLRNFSTVLLQGIENNGLGGNTIGEFKDSDIHHRLGTSTPLDGGEKSGKPGFGQIGSFPELVQKSSKET